MFDIASTSQQPYPNPTSCLFLSRLQTCLGRGWDKFPDDDDAGLFGDIFPPVGLDDGQHRLHARIVLCLELRGQGRNASIVGRCCYLSFWRPSPLSRITKTIQSKANATRAVASSVAS